MLNSATTTCLAVWKDSQIAVDLNPTSGQLYPYLSQGPTHDPNVSIFPDMPQMPIDEAEPASEPGSTPGFFSDDGIPLIDKLRERGTGNYTCQLGLACDKGGVLPNGQLKTWKRNCDYR